LSPIGVSSLRQNSWTVGSFDLALLLDHCIRLCGTNDDNTYMPVTIGRSCARLSDAIADCWKTADSTVHLMSSGVPFLMNFRLNGNFLSKSPGVLIVFSLTNNRIKSAFKY
jgi:hypothetical protein